MNNFLIYLNEKLGKGESFSPKNISWNISPKINAVCRSDDMEAKKILFKAFVGEYDMEEALKIAQKCHREQTSIVKRIYEDFVKTINHNHNVIICFGDSIDRNYLGLVANKIMGQFNKPTIILRELNEKTWSGSVRSPVPLLEQINESGLAKCQGHGEAFGIIIKKTKLEGLIKWFDEQSLETKPPIPVTAIITPKQATVGLAKRCISHSHLWGQGVEAPLFYITGSIHGSDVNVYQKKTNTIKFNIDGVDFLKFKATDEEVDLFSQNKLMDIEMIVKLETNEWRGKVSVQGLIEDYELVPHQSRQIQKDSCHWEDLF